MPTMPTTSTGTSSEERAAWLATTEFLDHDHDAIGELVERVTGAAAGTGDATTTAVLLFHAVRDSIRYDPYHVSYERDSYRASVIARSTANWCVPKSVLLTAAARRAGIPARLGFADVRNHLQSEKLRASMGTDLFVFHGYAEMWIDGAWRKASSAFNKELCERFGTKVLDFNGIDDALMHGFDESGNRHMEYVNQRGSYVDLPLEEILSTFAEVYGSEWGDDPRAEPDEAFA